VESYVVAMKTPLIACVDDGASVREALKGFLAASHFVAVTFESVEVLLEFENLCSVIWLIADVKLGGMMGVELRKGLVSKGYGIPTIIISAFSEEGYHQAAIDAGAADFLLKPISTERLLSVVNGALQAHEG